MTRTMFAQVRAAILVRALSLVNGNSKVRLSIVEALINALNREKGLQLKAVAFDRSLLRQLADSLAGDPLALCMIPWIFS